MGELIVLTAVGLVAWKWLDAYEVQEWLWEMWRFVKQIFPLLIVGVFVAGMVRVLIPRSLIEAIAGRNTVWANLVGVVFGVFMYFPTLVEVPIANMFLGLGMHRGPLLAYLMADPAVERSEHPDHRQDHRQQEGLGLCCLGDAVQHAGRTDLWSLGRRCFAGASCPLSTGSGGCGGGRPPGGPSSGPSKV